MAYRVMYRFTDDGEAWHEKSPDVYGWYENGHYRAIDNIEEAITYMQHLQRRFWRDFPDDEFEIKVIDAETLETNFSVSTATMDIKDWLK